MFGNGALFCVELATDLGAGFRTAGGSELNDKAVQKTEMVPS